MSTTDTSWAATTPATGAAPAGTAHPGDRSIYTIIRASAGSGKTHRLVDRLSDRLSQADAAGHPRVRPDQVIATTFTLRAAGELRTRIREHLVEQGTPTHLAQAAALPSALIGTINSITGRILQDFAMEAGLSPELSVLTEDAQKRAFALATSDILAAAEDTHRPLLTRMGYDLADDEDPTFHRGRWNWGDTVRQLVDLARANDIDAREFAAFARASRDELLAVLETSTGVEHPGLAPVDARARILQATADAADDLRGQLARGEIATRSVDGATRGLEFLERFVNTYGDRSAGQLATVPWGTWFKTLEGKYPGMDQKDPTVPVCNAVKALVDPTWLARDPALRADLADLVDLVFATAAECLAAYAEYKDALGLIDFTDQEHLTLHLIREHLGVRDALSDRYRILVVDEFQDTSPLQLALFTELGSLVDQVIWVGDPKQSIYAFRGSDPALMGAAVDAVTRGGGHHEVLTHSWRSHQVPLAFTNAVFSRVFPPSLPGGEGGRGAAGSQGRNPEVELTIPKELAGQRDGGEVAVWQMVRDKDRRGKRTNAEWCTTVVRGISDTRERDLDTSNDAHSWAVLTRTNAQAREILARLDSCGIPSIGGGTPLVHTREGATVRAALSWLIDARDTQSLVELIMVMREHPAHGDWMEQLSALPDVAARRDLLGRWGEDPSLLPVRRLEAALPELTVRETVVALVDALDLRARVAEWEEPRRRTGAIAGLVHAAEEFMGEADSAGRPATAAGFLQYLEPEPGTQDPPVTIQAAPGADAVTVTTIHQAKGLEWDSVVVLLDDQTDRFEPAGTWVEAQGPMSMEDPLAGRALRFWPKTLLGCALVGAAADTPSQVRRRTVEQREAERLFYVACTRAKWRIVLAPRTSVEKSGAPLELEDLYGRKDVTFDTIDVPADEVALEELAAMRRHESLDPAAWVDVDRRAITVGMPGAGVRHVPAAFAASGVQASDDLAAATRITRIADLGPALVRGGGPEWDRVGECIHAYLAAPYAQLGALERRSVAARLVTAWGVGRLVGVDQVVECGERWSAWVARTFPGATVATEVPVAWTNAGHQRMQGWVDQLLSLPDGRLVVVDHKTYPGADPIAHVREHYVGQMATYRAALTEISGQVPAGVLIHLPLLGEVLEVALPR